jgi:CheY-like chemotaxis protein
VILMDINLPGISGIEALKILREDSSTAHIPVIALSANAMPRDIEKGLQAGFFRYLTKPIRVSEFMETLEVAMEFAAHTVLQSK